MKPSRRVLLQGGLSASIAFSARGALAQAHAPVGINALATGEANAVKALAQTYLTEFGIPGLSVAVMRNGQPVYVQGFGVADAAGREPVTPAHLFRIASVSKPFTAVATFALIEQGHLRLTDRIFGRAGILGTDYGTQPYGRFIEDITVEHLLTHTAGGWANDHNDPMFAQPQLNQHQLISWVLDHASLASAPGTRFAYSNFGFCVLGRVLEQVTHRWYPTIVRDNVFHRCGIEDMLIANNTRALRAPGEVEYVGQGEDPYGINVARMDSHGGWVARASDLVRFIVAVDGAFAPPLLRPQTVALMTQPSPVNPSYAKGWAITGRNWWHNGGLPGTSAILVRTPGGLCWAALANSRRQTPDSVAGLDRLMWDMARAAKGWA